MTVTASCEVNVFQTLNKTLQIEKMNFEKPELKSVSVLCRFGHPYSFLYSLYYLELLFIF